MQHAIIGTDIEKAAALLRAGELVAIPTETVYGLAGNALNDRAVAKIFAVKDRPSFDPMIIHTDRFERVKKWVEEIPEKAQELADHFMPGPLTLLLPKRSIVPDIVTAGSPRVAVRIPEHPISRQLLAMLDFPLAAPSANPFGYISPTQAIHVFQQLGGKIPYILDGGSCQVGIESTIVGFEKGETIIYRKGGLAVEAVEAIVGPVKVRPHSSSNPQAPGMLKSHYAPKAPLILGNIREHLSKYPGKKVGIIAFRSPIAEVPHHQQVVLSERGDLQEAARRLFAGMRQLDALGLDIILAERVPEKGIGRAVNDRLSRAAAL